MLPSHIHTPEQFLLHFHALFERKEMSLSNVSVAGLSPTCKLECSGKEVICLKSPDIASSASEKLFVEVRLYRYRTPPGQTLSAGKTHSSMGDNRKPTKGAIRMNIGGRGGGQTRGVQLRDLRLQLTEQVQYIASKAHGYTPS